MVLGEGPEIMVQLPPDNAPSGGASNVAAPPVPARRVLLIEDNIDAAETLRDALELLGHEVVVVHDGPSGVAKARECAPDVVLCDVGLPGMDGFGVARALRAEDPARGAYLVALTGYARREDIEETRRAGFDEHLAKPPSLDKLESLIASVPLRNLPRK
jgi:two-component system CheB/CheR fusion protein